MEKVTFQFPNKAQYDLFLKSIELPEHYADEFDLTVKCSIQESQIEIVTVVFGAKVIG